MAAARAARPGGKAPKKAAPKPRAKAAPPRTRAEKHAAAREAGRNGQQAPAFIDDADLLSSYDAGANEAGAQPLDDTETQKPTPAPAPPWTPSGPTGGFGKTLGSTKSVPPVRPAGVQGEVAGAVAGVIATAFLINVIKGTWSQWLKSKFTNNTVASNAKTSQAQKNFESEGFLNQLGGGTPADPLAGTPGHPGNIPTPVSQQTNPGSIPGSARQGGTPVASK